MRYEVTYTAPGTTHQDGVLLDATNENEARQFARDYVARMTTINNVRERPDLVKARERRLAAKQQAK
jgi:hypothetical protein